MCASTRRRFAGLPRRVDLAAARHRVAGAAYRVGSVIVRDRVGERSRIDRPRLAEDTPGCAYHPVGLCEDRMRLPHAVAQLGQGVERKGMADSAGQNAQDSPILVRFARWEDGTARQLYPSLGGNVGTVFLGVGGPGQDYVRVRGTAIAVMSLIDHERSAKIVSIDFVGAEKVEQFDIA